MGSASIFDKSERADGTVARSELDGSYSVAGLNPSTSVQMATSSVSACRAVCRAKWVGGPADVQEDCEDAHGRGDEKAIVARSAKGKIGDHLGRANLSDQFAVPRVTLNPIGSANPKIALNIHPQTVWNPWRYFGKDSALPEFRPRHVECSHMMRSLLVRKKAGVGHIEHALVRREGKTVWHRKIVGDYGERPIQWVNAKDVAAVQFLWPLFSRVVRNYAVVWIGEPD